jgi:hypothetical protein
MTMKFNINGQEKTLNLKKNDYVSPNTPVYAIENGRITEWTSPAQV